MRPKQLRAYWAKKKVNDSNKPVMPESGWLSNSKCKKCGGKGYTNHWDKWYGATKPSCFPCQGTGKVWQDGYGK